MRMLFGHVAPKPHSSSCLTGTRRRKSTSSEGSLIPHQFTKCSHGELRLQIPKLARVSGESKGFIVTECLTSPSREKFRSVARRNTDNPATTSWKQLITIK